MWRETRDADIPVVIRHLYYYAGWAQMMEVWNLQIKNYKGPKHNISRRNIDWRNIHFNDLSPSWTCGLYTVLRGMEGTNLFDHKLPHNSPLFLPTTPFLRSAFFTIVKLLWYNFEPCHIVYNSWNYFILFFLFKE